MPNVHALIVGIDNYPIPAHRLEGCVNDAMATKQYLENRVDRSKYGFNMMTLINEQATRANIIKAFETHLAKAEANDIVFFYYSGHGSQEPAHEVFWHLEEDKKNETIVCYDSRIQDGMDLADKELATLIEVIAKKNPHFVVVMDCCHSGSGTRDLGTKPDFKSRMANEDRLVNGQVQSTRTAGSSAVRPLESYYLPQVIANRDIKLSKPQDLFVPSGRHVALSAAQSFQLAKETHLGGTRRGVFTYSLLEMLQASTGALSYQDIMRQVSSLVKQRTFDQTPQIYAQTLDDLNLSFLGGSSQRSVDYYAMNFDTQKQVWVIDGGSVHGLINGAIFNVYPANSSSDDMRNSAKAVGKATLSTLGVAESNVTLSSSLAPGMYRIRIDSMPVDPLDVYFSANTANDAPGVDLVLKTLQGSASASSYVKQAPNLQNAELQVVCREVKNSATGATSGAYIVARKTDPQPLIKQVIGYTQESAAKTVSNLVHISKWMQIFKLGNPGSKISTNAVQVQLVKETSNDLFPVTNGVIPFRYQQGTPAEKFRVKVVNKHSTKLYIGLLYMSSNFEANPGLFPAGGVWLEPGAEAWAINGMAINMQVEDAVKAFFGRKNAKGQIETSTTETFKLIFSTVEFDPKVMRMVALGQPDPQTRSAGGGGEGTRSLMIPTMDAAASGSTDDWNTSLLSLTVTRVDNA